MTPTEVYRAIMIELERRRMQLGISMDRLSEVAGIAERAYSKMVWAESESGRVARWETLQFVMNVLYPDGFDVVIKPKTGCLLNALSQKYKIRSAAAISDRKIQRELMRELGAKGGAARAESISPSRRSAIASAAGRARLKRLPAEQRIEQARKAAEIRWARTKTPDDAGSGR